MGYTMLEFAEDVLREIRKLQQSSQEIVLNGTISDMERYRFMMGRLEGLRMVEDAVKDLVGRYQKANDF
jgi:23S rRNA A1618 N6-methylase RlmF